MKCFSQKIAYNVSIIHGRGQTFRFDNGLADGGLQDDHCMRSGESSSPSIGGLSSTGLPSLRNSGESLVPNQLTIPSPGPGNEVAGNSKFSPAT